MFENDILTAGEMLLIIRKKYHITQTQLSGKGLSRQFVGAIEKGTNNITPHAARIIAENFNKFAEDEKIKERLTPEILQADRQTQVKSIFEYMAEELKNIDDIQEFEAVSSEIENFTREYSDVIKTKNKIDILIIIIAFYRKKNLYVKYKQYVLQCLELAYSIKDTTIISNMITKLTYVGLYLPEPEYKNVIIWGRNLINSGYANTTDLIYVHDNISRAYKALGKIKESIEELEFLQNNFDLDEEMTFKVRIVYANCLRENNDLVKSDVIYKEILDKAIKSYNKNYMCLAYGNLAQLNKMQGNLNEAAEYINNAINIDINFIEHIIMAEIYFVAFDIYMALNDYDNITKYFNMALNESIVANDNDAIIKLYKMILEYFINNKETDIIKLVNSLENYVLNGYVKSKDVIEILYKVSYFYFNKDEIKFKYIYNKIFNVIQYFEKNK